MSHSAVARNQRFATRARTRIFVGLLLACQSWLLSLLLLLLLLFFPFFYWLVSLLWLLLLLFFFVTSRNCIYIFGGVACSPTLHLWHVCASIFVHSVFMQRAPLLQLTCQQSELLNVAATFFWLCLRNFISKSWRFRVAKLHFLKF